MDKVLLSRLRNGQWFQLPDGEKTGFKMYGNDCRTRVCLGSKPVVINGEAQFATSVEQDWGPSTEVVPLDKFQERLDEEVNLNDEEVVLELEDEEVNLSLDVVDEEVNLDPNTGELQGE